MNFKEQLKIIKALPLREIRKYVSESKTDYIEPIEIISIILESDTVETIVDILSGNREDVSIDEAIELIQKHLEEIARILKKHFNLDFSDYVTNAKEK